MAVYFFILIEISNRDFFDSYSFLSFECVFLSCSTGDTIIKKGVIVLPKFISRLISRHLFSYLVIVAAYFYSINKFDRLPSFVSGLFILFVIISIAESNYQQYLENKANGKKSQTFKQFIHNVDWPIVIVVAGICILAYVALVILSFKI